MATNYILIDFENIQPGNLELLKQHLFRVLVFVGTKFGASRLAVKVCRAVSPACTNAG